jgi:MFS family permease
VQLQLEDTVEFLELQKSGGVKRRTAATPAPRSPVLEALRTHPKQIALAPGAFLAVQVPFYILIAFVIAYGTGAAGPGVSRNTMLGAVLVGAVAMIPSLPLAAAWSDRYGRRGVYMAGAALLAAWSFAVFPLIDTGSFLWICVSLAVGQVFVAMMYGPQGGIRRRDVHDSCALLRRVTRLSAWCDRRRRLRTIIATALLAEYQDTVGISIYMAIACAITLWSTWLLGETAARRAVASTAS